MDDLALHETSSPPRRSRRYLLVVALVIVGLLAGGLGAYRWYALYGPCEASEVKESSTFLAAQLNSYDRVYQVAVNASRDSYDLPVVVMQRIFLDTREVAVPACMQAAKVELLDYMETVIRAFRAWGAGEPDGAIRDLLDQSLAHYGKFKAEMKTVNECAPYCFP